MAALSARLLLATCSLALVIVVGSCGDDGGGAEGNRVVVGFSQIGAESGWRTANTRSIKEEAARRGIDLRFADAQGQQPNQIKALRAFIAQRVGAIAFSPVKATGWEPVLREAQRAGIPVLLTDREVEVSDPSLYATFIGSDFVLEGRMAAEWLAKKTGGKALIAELQGTPGSSPAIDRKRGFEEVLAAWPEMRIIKSQSGDFERAKGKEVFESLPQVLRRPAHHRALRPQRRHGSGGHPGHGRGWRRAGRGHPGRLHRRREGCLSRDGRRQAQLQRGVQSPDRAGGLRHHREDPRRRDRARSASSSRTRSSTSRWRRSSSTRAPTDGRVPAGSARRHPAIPRRPCPGRRGLRSRRRRDPRAHGRERGRQEHADQGGLPASTDPRPGRSGSRAAASGRDRRARPRHSGSAPSFRRSTSSPI